MSEQIDKFGVTLILPLCAFSTELHRGFVLKMLGDIDAQLTAQGAPEDSSARCDLMMENAMNICNMVTNNEVEHDDGVCDIACSFIYAFGKTIGLEQIDMLRGLTGVYAKNRLSLTPCLGEKEFYMESATLQAQMAEFDGDDWEPTFRADPTMH
jgi:hypothetical protein